MENLKTFRSKIDNIDKQMTQLLEERLIISLQIASLKTKDQLPLANPDREREVFEKNLLNLKNHLFKDEVKEFFTVLISLSKRVQANKYPNLNSPIEELGR